MSNRVCIYCLRQGQKFDKAHLFPQCIGGRYWYEEYCCKDCNNSIGRSLEGKLKGHPFFAFGIDKLGIQPPDEAYRDLRIEDKQTGERLKHVDGRLTGTSKIRSDGRRLGPWKELRKRAIDDVKKRFPNSAELYESELDKGSAAIKLPGEVHEFSMEKEYGQVEFIGKHPFPVNLLAKIAYEGMWLAGLFAQDSIQKFHRSTFNVAEADGRVQIQVASTFKKRVCLMNPALLRTIENYSELNYKPYHRLDFRVTDMGTAYVRITLFGLLSHIILVDRIEREKIVHKDCLNRAWFFPLEGPKFEYAEYPESILRVVQNENDFVDAVWNAKKGDFDG